ncbi:MAG: MarR family transcriptional regulator [Firmicutes bacterium]|nr:MarR family transcriptional regulator [Bacillota bacterium]
MTRGDAAAKSAEILHLLMICFRNFELALDRFAHQHWELTASQLRVLLYLRPGQAIPALHLARRLHLDPGTVSGLIRRVREKGLIKAEQLSADRRVQLISLTPRGEEVRKEILERAVATAPWQSLQSISDEERQQILDGLTWLARQVTPPEVLEWSLGELRALLGVAGDR